MHSLIKELKSQFQQQLDLISSEFALEQLKVKFLGKKGPVQQLMIGLREVSAEERPVLGKVINDLKDELTEVCEIKLKEVIAQQEKKQFESERLDVTLPGRKSNLGREHPLSKALNEMISILVEMGFSVQRGPDIDTDYYNFEALNFSPDHPARDMQDTFYISPNTVLRTHTTNVQVRVMEMHKPPIRIICPGRAYRNEAISARSHVFFHQIDAVYIDKGVSFADLFTTFDDFLLKLFKKKIETRYRPSYFPFVEPGVEVDIRCVVCQGKGCHICKHSGWLEICGAGMIHPEVLRNGGIDPEEYTGFAWGMGIERTLMVLKGIKDIRYFTENDLRFLEQFSA